ncbi:retrotransposable element Tf2 [Tanacetum coccineum]
MSFVIVDRLSKYAYFIPLSHPFNAMDVAQVFLDNINKLDGMPNTIASDRGRVFLCTFWKDLFKLLKVKLHMSTSYHSQADGQTEVVNRCFEYYLRAHDRMKSQADKRITYKEYAMGDWVYMKLQPHRQVTIKKGNKNKLSPNYYGPFQVQDILGQAVTEPEN